MSGMNTTPQLISDLKNQILTFPDSVLNEIHGFSISALTDREMTSKWVVTETYAAASRFHYDIWLKIFQHLTPKDIFSFVISAKGWSQCINLNLLRNNFLLLPNKHTDTPYGHINFISIISGHSVYGQRYCQGKLPLIHVESLDPLTLEKWEMISAKTSHTIPHVNITLYHAAEFLPYLMHNNQQLPNLREIDLSRTDITFAYLNALATAAPHLKKLHIYDCKNMSSTDLSVLKASSLCELETLSIGEKGLSVEAVGTLLKAAPHLKEITLHNCHDLKLGTLLNLFKNTHLKSLERLSISCPESNIAENLEVFLRIAPNLKSITLETEWASKKESGTINFSLLQENSLPALKMLKIDVKNLTMSNLQFILLAAPNLKELIINVDNKDSIEETRSLEVNPNHSLAKVTIYGYATDYLKALLHVAPNLKEVVIRDDRMNLEEALSHLKSSTLPNLSKFGLHKFRASSENDVPITTKDFQTILRVAPNLKQIKFEGAMIDDENDITNNRIDFAALSEYSFPSLTKINIMRIDVNNFESLLSRTPNLEKISLYSDEKSTTIDFSQLAQGSLAFLKDICISRANDLVLKNLAKLFLAAPNLREIRQNSDHIETSSGDLSQLSPNSLPLLRYLDLGLTDITIEHLKALLLAAHNLRGIQLSGAQNLNQGDLICLKELFFPILLDIELRQTKLSIHDIRALPIAFPNLEYFNLTNCRNISAGDFSDFKESLFPKVEVINLQNTNINTLDILGLLKAAPNLTVIFLDNCPNISTGSLSHLKEGSLPTLEQIGLMNTNINKDDLEALIKAAPHLKRIALDDCPNISEEDLTMIPNHIQISNPW